MTFAEHKFKINAVILDNGKDEIIECADLVKHEIREDYLAYIMDELKVRGY